MDELFGLAGIFQKIADHENTGTLTISKEGQEVYVYFKGGNVRSLGYPHKRSILAEGLRRCSKIPKELIDRIFSQQIKKKMSLLATIQESELDESFKSTPFITGLCSNQIGEELYQIMEWTDPHCSFGEGYVPEVLEPEMLELPINLNPSSLSMEGARRNDEWLLVREVIQSNKDVPYLVGSKEEMLKNKASLGETMEGASTETLEELLNTISGIRDFDEILEQARMSAFQAMKLLANLMKSGHIKLKEAKELKNLANLEILQQDVNKCIKLYERAEELGFKNPETIRWLAKAYENSGLTNKAVEKYRELGQISTDANLHEESIRAYDKVVKFAPEDLEAYEKLKNAYIKAGKLDKAADVSAIYARKVAVLDKRRAIGILDEANRNYPASHSNLELMATLYQQMGDKTNAILTYNILANLMKKQDRLNKALEAYQKILQIDPANTKAHLEIAKGYIEMSKVQDGVNQYNSLGQLLIDYLQGNRSKKASEEQEDACDLLMQVCEAMVNFEPNNVKAREWLVEAFLIQNDKKSALNVLREILGLLQTANDLEGLVKNLHKIVKMDPDDFQSRKRLADTLLRLKRSSEAIKEYMDLGNVAYKKNDVRRALEAFEAIIEIDPFHLYSRQQRADLLCALNRHAKAVEEYKLVGYLSKSVEKIPEAIRAFSKMVELAPEKEIWGAIEVARLCEAIQENDKAVAYYKKYSQNQRIKGNYGEVEMACSRILALEPNDSEARTLKREAEAKFTQLEVLLAQLK